MNITTPLSLYVQDCMLALDFPVNYTPTKYLVFRLLVITTDSGSSFFPLMMNGGKSGDFMGLLNELNYCKMNLSVCKVCNAFPWLSFNTMSFNMRLSSLNLVELTKYVVGKSSSFSQCCISS